MDSGFILGFAVGYIAILVVVALIKVWIGRG